VTQPVPTAEFSSLVYGSAGVALDDPAEVFHEASRLYPDVAPGHLLALFELAHSPELQQTVARSSRTHPQRPGVDLPQADIGRMPLEAALTQRRSGAAAEPGVLSAEHLAALLAAAYRSIGGLRPAPSGGALYPLELYVVVLAVESLEAASYHYDPFRHRLERIGPGVRAEVGAALVDPALAENASALVVITAMFWRSRFKYGLRGYRFALLEAGHVVQNIALAATALRIPALPLGGFYDRRVDDVVGADGLDEATVYAVLLGGRT
jgi:SagB-type dehydrogenase family enzyme